LGQGQWQVAEPVGERVGLGPGQLRGAVVQQGDGLVSGEYVQVQHVADRPEAAAAGGDEDVAAAARQYRLDVVDVLGVVEDQ
jgi:hypothetical protein